MKYSAHYISREDLGFNEFTEDIKLPLAIESGGYLLCLEGESQVIVDMKHYHIRAYDLVVAFPYSVVQMLHTSTDFRGVILSVHIDLFSNVNIPNKGLYLTNIKEAPCISLTRGEVDQLLFWYKTLTQEYSDQEYPFRREVNNSLLEITAYEIAAIFGKRRGKTQQQIQSREQVIFYDFIREVHQNYRTQRNLLFYAQKQQITSAHLSKVIKKASSRSASSWISECTIVNIKSQLKDQRRSIAEIAEEFSFANASFFSQYFKKYAGMTPNSYRRQESSSSKGGE
ncbi:MAG: AraC family transcriptional regulator [Rikenellaceae bacterium]